MKQTYPASLVKIQVDDVILWRHRSFSYTFPYIWRHPDKVLTSSQIWRHIQYFIFFLKYKGYFSITQSPSFSALFPWFFWEGGHMAPMVNTPRPSAPVTVFFSAGETCSSPNFYRGHRTPTTFYRGWFKLRYFLPGMIHTQVFFAIHIFCHPFFAIFCHPYFLPSINFSGDH